MHASQAAPHRWDEQRSSSSSDTRAHAVVPVRYADGAATSSGAISLLNRQWHCSAVGKQHLALMHAMPLTFSTLLYSNSRCYDKRHMNNATAAAGPTV
jgi:hypothetical protein